MFLGYLLLVRFLVFVVMFSEFVCCGGFGAWFRVFVRPLDCPGVIVVCFVLFGRLVDWL